MADDPKDKESLSELKRPPGIPEEYGPLYISAKDGTRLLIWGRIVKSKTTDGLDKLEIEGFIPD